MKKLLDNGTLVTLGLVGVVAAVGAANKAGLYGSRALLSTSGLSKLTDAELEDYWESLSPSMRNTEAWHLAVTERNVREYRLPNGPAYAAFKASRRSRGSPNEGSASYGVAVSASVEKDSLSGLWSVHLHNGRYIVNVTGDVFTTKAAADREAKAMLAQSRAGVAIDTLGSMFWEKHHKPLGSAARAMTRDEALSQLRSTGEISTGMLAPLGLSMDQFLRYAQLPTHRQKAFVDVLLQRAAAGSAARSTGSTRLRTLPFTFVNATAEESKGMFHPPQVIRIGKKRIVTPAGSGDDVDAYVYGDNVLVVVSNSRMPYYGATLYTDDEQGGYRVDQDVFLQGQEEVVDALGKNYDSLRDLTIANKLLAALS